jgi:aspartyl-tRNA(Asn)/glutamyl-tRNA(Gln) amidotransferase subunit C
MDLEGDPGLGPGFGQRCGSSLADLPRNCGGTGKKLNFCLRNMSVTFDEVRRIASLARLRLPSGEANVVAERMADVVGFAGEMASVPVPEAPAGGGSSEGAVREAEDVPGECLDREVVLANAPASRNGFVRLPPILRTGRRKVTDGEGSE